MIKYKFILTVVSLVLFAACRKEADWDGLSVTSREKKAIDELKIVLCGAPNGWKMTYFPSINTRLNTDITENYKTEVYSLTDVYLQRRMGVGGYNLFLKFKEGGRDGCPNRYRLCTYGCKKSLYSGVSDGD